MFARAARPYIHSVLIEVTHTTELRYAEPVRQSQMELRVCPAQLADQVRLSFELAIGPAAQVHGYFDWLDNHVHAFGINGRHDRIRFSAISIVQTNRPDTVLDDLKGLPDTWPCGDSVDSEYALYDFLTFNGAVADTPELRELADSVQAREGEPLGEVIVRALRLINDRFEYQTGVTTSATPVNEFIEQGRGVCQDFTHA